MEDSDRLAGGRRPKGQRCFGWLPATLSPSGTRSKRDFVINLALIGPACKLSGREPVEAGVWAPPIIVVVAAGDRLAGVCQ